MYKKWKIYVILLNLVVEYYDFNKMLDIFKKLYF